MPEVSYLVDRWWPWKPIAATRGRDRSAWNGLREIGRDDDLFYHCGHDERVEKSDGTLTNVYHHRWLFLRWMEPADATHAAVQAKLCDCVAGEAIVSAVGGYSQVGGTHDPLVFRLYLQVSALPGMWHEQETRRRFTKLVKGTVLSSRPHPTLGANQGSCTWVLPEMLLHVEYAKANLVGQGSR